MALSRPLARRSLIARAPLVVLGLLVSLVAGCGKDTVPLFPVSGKVSYGGAPMTLGTVQFHPDSNKGNASKLQPTGTIKSDGTYVLFTEGREGAPAGWYKVTVSGQGMPDPTKMTEGAKMPTPIKLDAKYTKPETTPFSAEVKDGAASGAYDFSIAK